MSVKGQVKEGAGFLKEEAYEHGKSPESQNKGSGRLRPAERRSY